MTDKILFDLSVCQPIGSSKFHGGGVYGFIVLKKLIENYPNNVDVIWDSSRFLPEDIKSIMSKSQIATYDLQSCTILEAFVKNKYNKLYSPLYNENNYPALIKANIPIMVTIHGLRALELGRDTTERLYSTTFKNKIISILKYTSFYKKIENKYKAQYKELFDYKNAKIVTVSEHSKASIKYFFPQIRNDINVRYSPNTSQDIPTTDYAFNNYKEKYYLIISADRWLKNSYRAIKAFESLYSSRADFDSKVYVVGMNSSHPIASKINNKDKFRFIDYLDRVDLEYTLKNAYSLVYPSLNEGFGYPPLEAMKYGTPVIASGVASIPEVCQDAVMYVNPYSVEEIANRVIQMNDPTTRDYYSKRGLIRYEQVKEIQDFHLDLLVKEIVES